MPNFINITFSTESSFSRCSFMTVFPSLDDVSETLDYFGVDDLLEDVKDDL